MRKQALDWGFRFVKGVLIGSGAILPGVSGGALAAVFGVYERIITFLAHIGRDFKKNVLFLLPIGLGGVFGIFIFSAALSFFYDACEAQLRWFFIGCIIGIFPALYAQAGREGRKKSHILLAAAVAAIMLVVLYSAEQFLTASLPQNFATWMMAGGIFALGIIMPGLSPSNFLLYLQLYQPMVDGIKSLDFAVILPVLVGAALTVLLFSKLVDYIFQKAYAVMFHIILGVVAASTVMIVPWDYAYLSFGGIACLFACILGIWLGAWMSKLERKYKKAA